MMTTTSGGEMTRYSETRRQTDNDDGDKWRRDELRQWGTTTNRRDGLETWHLEMTCRRCDKNLNGDESRRWHITRWRQHTVRRRRTQAITLNHSSRILNQTRLPITKSICEGPKWNDDNVDCNGPFFPTRSFGGRLANLAESIDFNFKSSKFTPKTNLLSS